jgi:hypothetical protein
MFARRRVIVFTTVAVLSATCAASADNEAAGVDPPLIADHLTSSLTFAAADVPTTAEEPVDLTGEWLEDSDSEYWRLIRIMQKPSMEISGTLLDTSEKESSEYRHVKGEWSITGNLTGRTLENGKKNDHWRAFPLRITVHKYPTHQASLNSVSRPTETGSRGDTITTNPEATARHRTSLGTIRALFA